MKTIEISNNIPSLTELLNVAMYENVIIITDEGREFVVAEIDDFDREIQLTRENQELMAFLDQRSQETTTFSLTEVRQHLGLN